MHSIANDFGYELRGNCLPAKTLSLFSNRYQCERLSILQVSDAMCEGFAAV